ncbi:unnamed protein product [Heterosigma akashiwo]|uniref:DM2 domain-containing protein n=1 Tax=Heterosigma akashiwo TaxID=2829 RepID=A0A6V1PA97_HETAK|mmetsp:Transcript_24952/g.37464  ORF Transcript_24952/g.37464 Transcript_24952/m.37464 type:complete len:330 (-) Transcript_24952:424-1413(-)|eukprot:CAMPEP_0194716416 /NCGR_PEP_ID=MMETSP0296-20130528/8135_1 /TAXON_ID=39354 /ORGANISM="Heterosigma akashiwo, Strain CCMP2393" /LENGTH=329 /DNA_ID=CAMNT_0039616805 /DNA_START=153 /DNA_END=1142 /DNA_ORIENTATION=-
MVSESELHHAIKEILKHADLERITPKQIRGQLEDQFNADLTDQKSYIKDVITRILTEPAEEPDPEDDNSDDDEDLQSEEEEHVTKGGRRASANGPGRAAPNKGRAPAKPKPKATAAGSAAKKKGSAFMKRMQLSSELASFMGTNFCPRTEVVKQMWAYIKENDLQNPRDKREILCDDQLQAIFKRKKINMFKMNKVLAGHMKTYEDLGGQSDGETERMEEAATPKQRATTTKKRKAATAGAAGKKEKKPANHPPWRISSELAAFVGKDRISRPGAVKALWEHIKGEDLQNPSDRREILCDAPLRAIFGQEKVTAFSMNKYLSQHFIEKV